MTRCKKADQTLCKNDGNPARRRLCRQARPRAGLPDVPQRPPKIYPGPSSSRLQELAGSRENGM